MGTLAGKEILLGVTGGIAAYKSAELVRLLKGRGALVTVVMTDAATGLVTPVTFAALSGRPVHTGLFDLPGGEMSHIELTARADAFIVAPATADIIGKMAAGIADNLLSTMLLAAKCPVLVAPAMNCRMFGNPAVQRNIRTLREAGISFIGPEKGPMACNEEGWGRMSEPAVIAESVSGLFEKADELAGMKVLVSAGPTIEDIDPVRFIGNRSTGKMGYAVAREARARGAEVTLVSGPTALEMPARVETVRVRSAAEMQKAMAENAGKADVIIMAAAVADYAPAEAAKGKIKKGQDELTLKLLKTPDILKGIGEGKRPGQVLVGFAAETEDIEENAAKKLKEKKLDLIAANPVGGDTGFASEYNVLKIYGPAGLLKDTGKVPKAEAAMALLDCIRDSCIKIGRTK